MPNVILAFLIGSASLAFAGVEEFKHEVRGEQTCVIGATPERCLKTLSLGEGIDILAQIRKYVDAIDDQGNPRPGVELKMAEVRDLAAGTGLSAENRQRTLERFQHLKVTRIASNIEEAQASNQSGEAAPANREVPFLAEIEWSDKSEPAKKSVALVEGRLVPGEKELELGQTDSAGLNQAFAALIRVDRVSTSELSDDLIRETIGPAVMANEYVIIVTSMIEHFGKTIGDILQRVLGEAFAKPGEGAAPPKP